MEIPEMDFRSIPQHLGLKADVIEVKLPAQLFNLVELASFELGQNTPAFHSALLSYFIDQFSKQTFSPFVLNRRLNHGLLKGKAIKHMKFSGWEISLKFNLIRAKSNLKSTVDIVKLVILNIYEEVLKRKNKQHIQTLKKRIAHFHTVYI